MTYTVMNFTQKKLQSKVGWGIKITEDLEYGKTLIILKSALKYCKATGFNKGRKVMCLTDRALLSV